MGQRGRVSAGGDGRGLITLRGLRNRSGGPWNGAMHGAMP